MNSVLTISLTFLLVLSLNLDASELTIKDRYPHALNVYTQGLIIHDGMLCESSGQYKKSFIQCVDLSNNKVLNKKAIESQYFAEGLTELNDKLYMLTWKAGKGFVFDKQTFELLQSFDYEGEGWGLTDDGEHLIMSDGTNKLKWLDASSYEVIREIKVRENGMPVLMLNELEWIKEKIWANVYHTQDIVVINPDTGAVEKRYHFTSLPKNKNIRKPEVLNGIAYDSLLDKIYITGKYWGEVFEVKGEE